MSLYVKSTRSGVDYYSKHDGMDTATITTLLENLGSTDIQFITEGEWIAANPPKE